MDSTASQTVGPFFRIGLSWLNGTSTGAADIAVHGRVLDGQGQPVPDAVLEIWQPGGGFCRVPTGPDGGFRFTSAKVSHLVVLIFMRGLLKQLMTRICFEPDDPALHLVPEERRATLIPDEDGQWSVVLQGEDETVFFEV